ncbi:MAG: DUF3488 and transglutaminase-like domain-containing protein [Gammaproteobacteria bacterium]
MKAVELYMDRIVWLSAGIILAGLPHWERLPIWIPVLHLGLIIARIYFPWKHARFWNRNQTAINIFRLLVMFGGVIGVYSTYGTFAGRDVGITLLVMLSALKLFESYSERDYYICAYLGYFLVITNFFYEQTIPTAIYMFFVVIVMTTSLIGFNDHKRQIPVARKVRLAFNMLLQAVPLLLILFILFPRVDGPLWGLPEDAFSSITGIDDQMTPGSISKLSQSGEIAFRVKFDGEIPDPSRLYWRGPVLWQTDGRKWTRGAGSRADEQVEVQYMGESIAYNLMLEPTNKKWIFAMEMAADTPVNTYFTNDMQLKARDTIQTRKTYDLESYSDYRMQEVSQNNLLRALALPELYHEQSRELGMEFRDRYQEPERIIEAILDWFSEQEFVYTLQPPISSGDSIDDFLFNSQQGFCEHYAAAFTVLMRSAGIPARVVAGYQGGEINPVGDYLVVRQYHAHAWTEVWLQDKGWIRIDPTRAVSPNRINQGIEQVLPGDIASVVSLGNNSSMLTRLWQQVRNAVDNVNYQWAQWVLGYGPDKQQQLMQLLGFGLVDWKKLTIMLFTVLGVAIVCLTIYVLTRKTNADDPARASYDRFCRKLARIGLARNYSEGPDTYAWRVQQARQDLAAEVERVTRLYIDVRYRSQHEKLQELKQASNNFNPRRQLTNR